MRLIIVFVIGRGTKSSDLDDLPAKPHMRQPKATPDQAAIIKQRTNLLRCGISRDIEILGVQVQDCITHAATDQERLIAGLVQAIQHFQGGRGDFVSRDVMVGARDNRWRRGPGITGIFQMNFA